MKKAILILVCIFAANLSFSQDLNLRGTLIDSVEKANLQNTVVSILRASDSVLVKFTRTDRNGLFHISGLKKGHYIFLATHPYYGDFIEEIEFKDNQSMDLGNLFLTPKSKLLAEVIIKSGSPIRIKGDTTIYTADSFKVSAGANVEELLRRLPGIQVGRNGEITAMGERVTKVLVDGEEFFGSDPGIATKNLRADMVKEVQVFDKKSDQAAFTGIDDGIKDKTINLKMKNLSGYFGKVEAGGGLQDKYNHAAMLNSFKAKRKMAGYGILSNTGSTYLDWRDEQNYGGGRNVVVGEDGGVMISQYNDFSSRNGIPTNQNAGFHYNNKINNDKLSYNVGYRFSAITAPGLTSVFSSIFLPDTSWSMNSINKSTYKSEKNDFNLTVEQQIDSMNSLKWTTQFNRFLLTTGNNFEAETLNPDGDYINTSTRLFNNHQERNGLTSSLLWKHKFKKLHRTLSINTDFSWTESKNSGFMYAINNYYQHAQIIDRDTTDQQNIQNSESTTVNSRIAYTEPLFKDIYLELSYAISVFNNANERLTRIQSQNGKYDNIVDTLSNSFVFNRLVYTPGLGFRMNKKKFSYSLSGVVSLSQFEQKNKTLDQLDKYNFLNFFPRATFNYKIKPNESLNFNYNGNTNAPTLEQLQPVRINTDPLNIFIGNPDLVQSFLHSVNSRYSNYNTLKGRNIYTTISMSTTQNAFVQSNTVDIFGKRTYQTVNTNGIYNLRFNGNYSRKITKAGINTGIGPTVSFDQRVDFVNGIKNITKTKSLGFNMEINKYVEKKYNLGFYPVMTWNKTEASVYSSANAHYWNLEGWAYANVSITKKLEIVSDLRLQYRQNDPRFPQNNNFSIWNASINKKMLKDNALVLQLKVNDILNQNRGYQRNFNSFSFRETYYVTLRRFWLVSLTWNLSKNGKPL